MMENKTRISLFQGMMHQKCPHCREGKMFEFATYNVSKFSKMHNKCPNCGQDFVVEPGFYTGAMYFSYAFNVAILVIFGLGFNILFNPDVLILTAIVIGISFLAMPLNFRYSRILMIYLFSGIKFKENN